MSISNRECKKRSIKILSSVTLVLFVISTILYVNEHKKGKFTYVGNYFFAGLDVDKVYKVEFKGGSNTITLNKDGDSFFISPKNYPAKMEKINTLLFDLSNLTIFKKVTSDATKFDFYKVSEKEFNKEIVLYDADGNKLYSAYFGKSDKSNAIHIRHKDEKTVYLSQVEITLSLSENSYINTSVIDIEKKDISKMGHFSSSKYFNIKKQDKDQFVGNYKNGKKIEDDKVNSYIDSLRSITFNKYYQGDNSQFLGKSFSNKIEIESTNGVIYKLSFYKDKDAKKIFFKATAAVADESAQGGEIMVDRNDKKQLAKVENIFKAQEIAQKFNLAHQQWVYQTGEIDLE